MAESRSANVRSSTQILAERFSEESGNAAHFFNLKIAGAKAASKATSST
jgi:hypothetical protein